MHIPLYEPLNTLKPIGKGIWMVDGDLIQMSVGCGSLPFSTRMTVVQLADGSLWCHSPIAPNESLFQALDSLGPVAHLISPNKIHYAYIPDWQRRYPQAKAWSSPGVEERAASQKIAVNFDAALENRAPEDWAGQLDQLIFSGSRAVEEVVFFHRASQTLIVTDLIENFEVNKMPHALQRGFYRFARIADPDGQTPIDFRMSFLGRRAQAKACMDQVLAWQPERVIMAHGRPYLENGTAELKRAWRWIQ